MKKLQLPFEKLMQTMEDSTLFEQEKEDEIRLHLRILEAQKELAYSSSESEMEAAVKNEVLRYRRNKHVWQIMRPRRGSDV
jgi:hypothetical protein